MGGNATKQVLAQNDQQRQMIQEEFQDLELFYKLLVLQV